MDIKSTSIGRIIGMECLYLFLMQFVALLGEFVQMIGKSYEDVNSSIIFSGTLYGYNYFSYTLGVVLYLGAGFFLYKWILKEYFFALNGYNVGFRLLAWIISLIFSLIMLWLILAEYFLLYGLSDSLFPRWLFLVTMFGWPIITTGFITVLLVKISFDQPNELESGSGGA